MIDMLAKPDTISREFMFRNQILRFCDNKVKHVLRLKNLLKSNHLDYKEFCLTLIDLDDLDNSPDLEEQSHNETSNSAKIMVTTTAQSRQGVLHIGKPA